MIDTDSNIESPHLFGVLKRKTKMLFSCFGIADGAVTQSPQKKSKQAKEDRKGEEMRKKRKVVVVGDGECGKTCLLQRFCRDTYNVHGYLPTVFDTDIIDVQMDKTTVELKLTDTAGQEDYDRLRPYSYPDTDVIIICFAVDNADSLENVRLNWVPEVRYFCGSDIPILLVGNKRDVRIYDDLDGGQTGSTNINVESGCDDLCQRPSATLIKQGPVKASYARKVAEELDAVGYWETSAMLDQGVTEVFQAAAREALKPRPRKNSKKRAGKQKSGRKGFLERIGLRRG